MPLIFDYVDPATDVGLGYLAECTCTDYETKKWRVMSRQDLASRWQRAQTEAITSQLLVRRGDVARYEVNDQYEVIISKGKGDPGPHWWCKHCMVCLREDMRYRYGVLLWGLAHPDDMDAPSSVQIVSIDGWLNCWYAGKEIET